MSDEGDLLKKNFGWACCNFIIVIPARVNGCDGDWPRGVAISNEAEGSVAKKSV